jgi:hypothetical protein
MVSGDTTREPVGTCSYPTKCRVPIRSCRAKRKIGNQVQYLALTSQTIQTIRKPNDVQRHTKHHLGFRPLLWIKKMKIITIEYCFPNCPKKRFLGQSKEEAIGKALLKGELKAEDLNGIEYITIEEVN